MEVAHEGLSFGFGSARVALTPISSPSTRRLSSSFNDRSRPVPAARRKLAWVSLEGRVVNAHEASSARAIKGGLSPQEAVAWELFSPIHRFLFVAVISVASAESKKNRHISQLKKSVELRDQILSSMQQKLDSLCEQLINIKDHTGSVDPSTLENVEVQSNESFGSNKIKFVDCGCWLCDQHRDLQNGLGVNNVMKASNGEEILQYKMSFASLQEQEERRMSGLSDLASSVTSAADIQNTIAIEQDIYNLRKDCEEKDGSIQELTTLLHSAENAGSKRIAELEDIIRRKNSTITRLKRDMVVLEQKVVQLTRLQRPSFSSSNYANDAIDAHFPHMTDNLLYDMESSTSPSSSDSDSPVNRAKAHVNRAQAPHVIRAQASHVNQENQPHASHANQEQATHKSSPSSSDSDSLPVNGAQSHVNRAQASHVNQEQAPNVTQEQAPHVNQAEASNVNQELVPHESSPPLNRAQVPPVAKTPEVAQTLDSVQTCQKPVPEKASISMAKPTDSRIKSQPLNPLKEITMNLRPLRSLSKASQPLSPKSRPATPKSQPETPKSRPVTPKSPETPTSRPATPKSQLATPRSQIETPMSSIRKSISIQSSRPRKVAATAGPKKIIKRRSLHTLPVKKDAASSTSQKRWA